MFWENIIMGKTSKLRGRPKAYDTKLSMKIDKWPE